MTRTSAPTTKSRELQPTPSKWLPFRNGIVFGLLATAICLFAHSTFAQAATVEVELRDGQISPSQMTASVNKSLSIHVTNRGSKTHNLVIPDFFIFTQNLAPGKDVRVEFAPSKKGTFPYYSDAGGKPEPGMQGNLTVNP